jgi:hypothetical protein
MTFPTITIPDPAAVGKWLDEQLPNRDGSSHMPSRYADRWRALYWTSGSKYVSASGDTPEALLADIRQLAENDPLEKLRKEWVAAGRPKLD